ncbi:MAG: hypothetical protein AB1571_02650 [Nanoarchaeota archaeon]
MSIEETVLSNIQQRPSDIQSIVNTPSADLIMCDIQIPRMEGKKLLTELPKDLKNLIFCVSQRESWSPGEYITIFEVNSGYTFLTRCIATSYRAYEERQVHFSSKNDFEKMVEVRGIKPEPQFELLHEIYKREWKDIESKIKEEEEKLLYGKKIRFSTTELPHAYILIFSCYKQMTENEWLKEFSEIVKDEKYFPQLFSHSNFKKAVLDLKEIKLIDYIDDKLYPTEEAKYLLKNLNLI